MDYCGIKGCWTIVTNNSKYCIDHKCLICDKNCEPFNIYCSTHICKYSICCPNNAISEYCISDLIFIKNNLNNNMINKNKFTEYIYHIDDGLYTVDLETNDDEEIDIITLIVDTYKDEFPNTCRNHLILMIKNILLDIE